MAFWLCDTHGTAGHISKRSWVKNRNELGFENCEVRIISDDNAEALGWKGMGMRYPYFFSSGFFSVVFDSGAVAGVGLGLFRAMFNLLNNLIRVE